MSEVEKKSYRERKPRKSLENKPKKKHPLSTQLEKKKYSRPLDDKTLDDISDWMTSLEVKAMSWTPTGTWDGSQPKRYHKFEPLFDTDVERDGEMRNTIRTRLQCITAMKQYEDMSFEELRLGDHMAGFRYKEFPSGTTLFRQATPKNSEIARHWPLTGTKSVEFYPTEGEDEEEYSGMTQVTLTDNQCITSMPEYEDKSLEELRLEDYMAGLHFTNGFEFGGSKQRSYWSESLPKYLIASRRNDVATEFLPKLRTDYMRESENDMGTLPESNYVGQTRHQCITAMFEYESISFEELRLKDYLSRRKGPRGPHFEASQEELNDLQIHHDMKVYIFMNIGGNEVREKAKVKFIGRVPKKAFGKLHAGVELGRAVGDCDGFYQGVRLFRTAPYYAKIVPLTAVFPRQMFDSFLSGESDEETEGNADGILDEELESKKCIVCMTNPVEIHLSPCGHVCCCDECSKRVTTCPMCRRYIERRSKAYLP